jgi:PKHD-type hydroxylase
MIVIKGVLSADAAAAMRERLAAADWIDGNATSGHQSALAKRNRQLPEDSVAARDLGGQILDALGRAPLFVAAALPAKVFPPLFNLYAGGEAFGDHVDNAVRFRSGTDFRLRSDLSATLFLSDPDSYDGGELVAEGQAPVKLPAGDMILYPA